ncbi:MAG: glutamate--tRNA ligase [Bacteroidales bacterium]|nr:glutamate--tRNA ligase [Bacteroidales bacterium]
MPRKVRVRFAPSPTGPLHIGGVRTALFNYLFAVKHKGDFILRIEDTDQARFVPGAEAYIMESLKWCGLHYNEGPDIGGPHEPYRQSDRKDLYRQYAENLISSGNAYYAFDEPDTLDSLRKQYESEGKVFQYDASTRLTLRNSLTLSEEEVTRLIETSTPHVIRFKMPENEEIRTTDLIRGEVTFHTALLDDKVLYKADGLPTYHLAHLIDDFLMEITHVIRGEEWLPSFPLHVLLYKAFGWENDMPQYAHLPLILKPGGQGKLSKRDGDKMGFPVFPLQWTDPFTGEVSSGYRESGYFPEAVINMLAFLGWNPGTEAEFFTLDELVDAFTFDRVGKSGARFDPEKAKWYNQQYLKYKSDEELTSLFIPILQKKGFPINPRHIKKVTALIKERLVFPQDFWEQAFYFFEGPESYDQQMQKKVWKEDTPGIIASVRELLKETKDFSSAGLEALIKNYIEQNNIGFGRVAAPLRLLIVGSGMGPHLFDILEMIGKEETIRRINKGLEMIQ